MTHIKNLVSIITPCYNSGKYITYLLESILAQSYPLMEVIVVVDGSTDDTAKIIKSYNHRFEERGIRYIYIYQKNSGQATAVENGLKYVQGEFLMWPDSDDFYKDEVVANRVSVLKKHPEVGLLRTGVVIINESDDNVDQYDGGDEVVDYTLFERVLMAQQFMFAPIGFMVRMSCFLEVNPARTIFKGRGGQNWQMLLPLLYKFPSIHIKEIDCFYLVREHSHSRNHKSPKETISRLKEHKIILSATIERIQCNRLEKIKLKAKITWHLNKKIIRVRFPSL